MNTSTYIRASVMAAMLAGENKQVSALHPIKKERDAAKIEYERRIEQAKKFGEKAQEDVEWLYSMLWK